MVSRLIITSLSKILFNFQIRKSITCIIKLFNKIYLVISRIRIPRSSQNYHLNFISLMPRRSKRLQTIISLFHRIKLIQPCTHSSRFRFYITFRHSWIIRTKYTLSRTWPRFSQNLNRHNSR